MIEGGFYVYLISFSSPLPNGCSIRIWYCTLIMGTSIPLLPYRYNGTKRPIMVICLFFFFSIDPIYQSSFTSFPSPLSLSLCLFIFLSFVFRLLYHNVECRSSTKRDHFSLNFPQVTDNDFLAVHSSESYYTPLVSPFLSPSEYSMR